MAEKNINAYCSICGNGYHVCRSCLEQETFKPWRTVVDSIDHYMIYMAIHDYTISKDKEKAKRALESCNLSGLENFKPEIKTVIQEIIAEQKKTRIVSKKEKTIVEAELDAETETEKEEVVEKNDTIEN